MSKRKDIIYGGIAYVLAFGSLVAIVLFANNRYTTNTKRIALIAMFVLGAVVFGLVNAGFHELGHVIFGKRNNFEILACTVWFLRWARKNKKYKFSFCLIGNEAGYTESAPKSTENMDKRLVSMTRGGLVFSFFMVILSIIPIIFVGKIPQLLFCFLAVSLPISVYYFLWNLFPIKSSFAFNDGAVIWQVKHKTDTSKVMLSLLKIHSEIYNGKTPSEVDKDLYFDVPQLPEDDVYFANLLNARYNYYLDLFDYQNAKDVLERLLTLIDYLPKEYEMVIKTDALFNACVIDKDEEKAEDYLYEVEDYVNKVNTATNLRVKMAYLLFEKEEGASIDMFYNKAIKEAKKSQLKGLELFEIKQIEKVMGKIV